jgi:hypothetical protein
MSSPVAASGVGVAPGMGHISRHGAPELRLTEAAEPLPDQTSLPEEPETSAAARRSCRIRAFALVRAAAHPWESPSQAGVGTTNEQCAGYNRINHPLASLLLTPTDLDLGGDLSAMGSERFDEPETSFRVSW